MNSKSYYKGKDSLYKFSDEWQLNSYEFDIIKRIVRCRHKGVFHQDLQKTIDVIKIYSKEQVFKQELKEKGSIANLVTTTNKH